MLAVFTLPVFYLPTLLSFLPKPASSQLDNTLVDGAYGKDITQAVIRKIIRSQIFPEDHSFLFRLANVESMFGMSSNTYRPSFFGGIWQVDQTKLEATINPTNESNSAVLLPLHGRIEVYFGIEWKSLVWRDLLKPLYSALAARLYLMISTTESIPDTIRGQARYWKNNYRTDGDEILFEFESYAIQLVSVGCPGKLDLCIGLDGSKNVTEESFKTGKDFIGSLLQTFSKKHHQYTQLGMFVFGDTFYPAFEVKNMLSIGEMKTLVQDAKYPSGDRYINLALDFGVESLTQAKTHEGISQVILLFTGGHSSHSVNESTFLVDANNITTIVVAVGNRNGFNETELLQIALGETKNVFFVSEFKALPDFLLRLSTVLCGLPQKPLVVGEKYADILKGNENRYYILEMPSPEGVTITMKAKEGVVDAYWSYEDEMPFEFVNDGAIDGLTFIPAQGKAKRIGGNTNEEVVLRSKLFITVKGAGGPGVTSEYEFFIQEGDQEHQTGNSSPATPLCCCELLIFTVYFIVYLCLIG